jgi:hypothetical protein
MKSRSSQAGKRVSAGLVNVPESRNDRMPVQAPPHNLRRGRGAGRKRRRRGVTEREGAVDVSQADGEAVPVVPVTARRKGSTVEPDGCRAGTPGLESGYDEMVAEPERRYRARPDEAGRPVGGQTVEHEAALGVYEAAGAPGLRLVIGVDGDPRQWVRVANALLDCIASGAVRVGSRVPPVTSLGLEAAVPPGTARRAFRVLASSGRGRR